MAPTTTTTESATASASEPRSPRSPDGSPALTRASRRAAQVGLLVTLLLATGLHGAVELWAAALVGLTVLATVAVWLAGDLALGRLTYRPSPLHLPALALAAIGLLSLLTTLAPYQTRLELGRLLVLLLFLLLATQLLASRRDIVAAAWAISLLGVGLAVTSLLAGGSSQRLVFGFANPDHLGGFLAISAVVATGLVVASSGVPRYLLAGLLVWTLVAIVRTGSRGALLALVAGLIALALARIATRRRARTLILPLALAALAASVALVLGSTPALGRLATMARPLALSPVRLATWRATVDMVRERPFAGSGLGSFEDAFSAYQPPGLTTTVVNHAHNDYLEAAAELGLPGLAAALALLVCFAVAAVRGLRRQQDPLLAGIAAGAIGGCAVAAAHATVDFVLRVPAIAMLAAACAALGCAAACSPAEPVRLALLGWRRAAALAALAVSLLAAAFALAAPVLGSRLLDQARRLAAAGHPDTALAALDRAARFDPRNPGLAGERGDILLRQAVEGGLGKRAERLEAALAAFEQASAQAPLRESLVAQQAAVLRLLGRQAEAETALRKAIRLAPSRAVGYSQLADLLLETGRGVEARACLRDAAAADHRSLEPALERLWKAGEPPAAMAEVVPKTAPARLTFARFLERLGEVGAAADQAELAASLEPGPATAAEAVRLAAAAGRKEQALAAAASAVARWPGDERLLRQSFALSLELGRLKEAEEQARSLIRLEPAAASGQVALASVEQRRGDWAAATAALRQAVALEPRNARAFADLGACLRRLGRGEEAAAAFASAVALEPDHAEHHHQLGLSLLDLGRNRDAARELAACLELAPTNGGCQQALARASRAERVVHSNP